MSQVKNLLAMFEGNTSTSPPERGRASGASTPTQTQTPGASGTNSPRPLSKVRTNFVAIEKDGRIGLRRDPSHESSVSRRRLSMDSATSSNVAAERPLTAPGDESRPAKPFLNEPIPESPMQPSHEAAAEAAADAAVTDEPSTNPDKQVDEEQPSASLLPAEPAQLAPADATEATNGKTKADKPKATASTTSSKATPSKTATARTGTTSAKTATSKPARSPSAVRPPTKTAHKAEAHPTSKAAEKPAARKESATAARTAPSITKPTATSAAKKPQPLKASSSETGFGKPKPKSPTKPVSLPASLTAPTASSVSKTGSSRQSLTRQSDAAQAHKPIASSSSRAGASTATASATAGKTVKRQPAVAAATGHSRASIGPPPKKTVPEKTAHKKDAPVDEGFLARMMRPTAASSSKTSDKGPTPTTPPKKTTRRPSTVGTKPSSRPESRTRATGSAKKPVRRAAGSAASSEAAAPTNPHAVSTEEAVPETAEAETAEGAAEPTTATREIAPETAQVETVEEAVELAKEADLAQPLDETASEKEAISEIVKEEPAEKTVELTKDVNLETSQGEAALEDSLSINAEAIAPETAKVETVEEAVALAKEADLVQTSETKTDELTEPASKSEEAKIEETVNETTNKPNRDLEPMVETAKTEQPLAPTEVSVSEKPSSSRSAPTANGEVVTSALENEVVEQKAEEVNGANEKQQDTNGAPALPVSQPDIATKPTLDDSTKTEKAVAESEQPTLLETGSHETPAKSTDSSTVSKAKEDDGTSVDEWLASEIEQEKEDKAAETVEDLKRDSLGEQKQRVSVQ